ncbi:21 kDa protein-like [Nicotiana tomentosiformis]|uniref:21 kDa protein-like n=1 Tax=Nicotiana tomentosiformis TaxID=4098 RepID=UPI00051B7956|nr:21 kDa protein-like [Nicotiana tomentosiformis]
MKTPRPFSLFCILFAAVLLHLRLVPSFALLDPTAFSSVAVVPDAAAPQPLNPGFVSADTNYIRSSCKTTMYPATCYHSLNHYATAVQQDSARLARVAVGVSLAKAKRTAAFFSNLSREAGYGAQPRVVAALHDCFSIFGDAVDQIRDSLSQMRRLGGSSESLRFQMSNVQTWMSAALTNEDTCTDGFEDVTDDEPMKLNVCDRVGKVKEVTSNALALVNSFANKISTP